MKQEAWVTLATNDDYAIGALVLGQSLRNVNTSKKLHIIITTGVKEKIRKHLLRIFDDVSEVNPLNSQDQANLLMIRRPDLAVTFTKLHCWRLIQYSKCVFVDADCLMLQNCDELFDYPEFSAAPDIGWPDIFNTGVFVMVPSYNTYDTLAQFAEKEGSFDGGDQGLLNDFFSNWRMSKECRLPFIYNTSSSVSYTYIAAFQRFSKDIKVVHFLGSSKPWHYKYNVISGELVGMDSGYYNVDHVRLWWSTFAGHIMTFLYDIPSLNIRRQMDVEQPRPHYQGSQEPPPYQQGPSYQYVPHETIQYQSEQVFHAPQYQAPAPAPYYQPPPATYYQPSAPPYHWSPEDSQYHVYQQPPYQAPFFEPPPMASVTYNIEPVGYIYRPDISPAPYIPPADHTYRGHQEWTLAPAVEPPQAEYTKQPWTPAELPSFIAAEPPAVDKTTTARVEILQPALAETAREMPQIFDEKPRETLELFKDLSKILPPELLSETLKPTDYPSWDYSNRLTSCPLCNESFSYLDDYFPAIEEQEILEQKETKEEGAPAAAGKTDEFEYEDYEHKLAWEQGNIDYRGRDSWEQIRQYLDRKLK